MNFENQTTQPPKHPKKFYFLEYFYILLQSIEASSSQSEIFSKFIYLKAKYLLGESRYRKIVSEEDGKNSRRIGRYRYTFKQVLSEAVEYELVITLGSQITIQPMGKQALEIYKNHGQSEFNYFLGQIMEKHYRAFRYLIEKCYQVNANPRNAGLLIFPIYSAYKLEFERDTLQTVSDLKEYFKQLAIRLEQDIEKYLAKKVSLSAKNDELIEDLIKAGFISSSSGHDKFKKDDYNVILKRARDFWLRYFLQDLYQFDISLTSFELWAYRAKQIGILHITEFYPDLNFNGRIIYPLSAIKIQNPNPSFRQLVTYSDQKGLYMHIPVWNDGEEFVNSLHRAYVETRQTAKTYFVSLPAVRERVCYNLKMPEYLFDDYLGRAYRIRDSLKIRISLEVDKLPEKSNLTYLHREPVIVDGRYRNIIAIDLV